MREHELELVAGAVIATEFAFAVLAFEPAPACIGFVGLHLSSEEFVEAVEKLQLETADFVDKVVVRLTAAPVVVVVVVVAVVAIVAESADFFAAGTGYSLP